MKPKAKTLIERQGFLDPDRGANHDDIQIWVHNNIVDVLKTLSTDGRVFNVGLKKLEHPIIHPVYSNQSVVGFVDLFVIGNIHDQHGEFIKSFYASIEIKSVIPSCGDLIRQINFYRKYEPFSTTWIVVSPDDRFKEILHQQGIYFYKYKDPSMLF